MVQLAALYVFVFLVSCCLPWFLSVAKFLQYVTYDTSDNINHVYPMFYACSKVRSVSLLYYFSVYITFEWNIKPGFN